MPPYSPEGKTSEPENRLNTRTARLPYRLGLPAWAFPAWRGRYFPTEETTLAGYARVFNAVEGNTTFYRIPDADTVRRWRAALAGRDFRISFKLPREVTHEPIPDLAAARAFLRAIEPLRDHLGPLLLQFPATVGPENLKTFEPVFSALPGGPGHVLEVRHPRFFTEPALLEPVLRRFGLGRVVLDSRPLYQGDRTHPEVTRALHEKPDVPVLDEVYAGILFVRLILHPDGTSNRVYLDEWADKVSAHLNLGRRVYMMIHCPNNLHCPEFAREFHGGLRQRLGAKHLPGLPDWPVPQQTPLL